MHQANNVDVILRHSTAPKDAICLAHNGILNQQTILASLQDQFSFPDYFGENLDAAFDMLLDVVDSLKEPTVWRYYTGNNTEMESEALVGWQQVMHDVIQYAHKKGITLHVELFAAP